LKLGWGLIFFYKDLLDEDDFFQIYFPPAVISTKKRACEEGYQPLEEEKELLHGLIEDNNFLIE
jgi:hypothetical protein